MKKLILISAIAIVTLASCGESYLVHNIANNRLEYLQSSEVGNDFKVGDTIRTQNVHRLTDIGNAFEATKFEGIVISVENN